MRQLALLTMGTWGGAYPRVGRWMQQGFEDIGRHFDLVLLEGPEGVTQRTFTREVRLGSSRARSSLLRVARYIRDERPALIFATPSVISLLALPLAKVMKQPLVPWEPTFSALDVRDLPRALRVYPWVQGAAYRFVPAVVAVSQDVASVLIDRGRSFRWSARVHVLPNPVDVSGIRAEASDRLPRDGRFTFCVSGRLASQKGIDVLIRALALARDGLGQDWRCRILGEGELRGPLEALVASLGLEAHVDFLGHLTDPYSVMAACDVFVHPARWEGFGLVVAEALALGLPVIATTCPGAPKEMLEGGELGWLVPPDDPSALARALLQAAQDDDQRKRFAESAPQALARYAPGRVAQLACSLADEIVK